MALMTWTNEMSVGVRVLDEDHKKIVAMINELHEAMRAGRGGDVLDRILDRLVKYTVEHFAREERFFAQTSYPDASKHHKQHEELRSRVAAIQRESAKGGGANLTIDTMNFLTSWLANHILGSDRQYRDHLNANGVY